jgi:hypothetical protein
MMPESLASGVILNPEATYKNGKWPVSIGAEA